MSRGTGDFKPNQKGRRINVHLIRRPVPFTRSTRSARQSEDYGHPGGHPSWRGRPALVVPSTVELSGIPGAIQPPSQGPKPYYPNQRLVEAAGIEAASLVFETRRQCATFVVSPGGGNELRSNSLSSPVPWSPQESSPVVERWWQAAGTVSRRRLVICRCVAETRCPQPPGPGMIPTRRSLRARTLSGGSGGGIRPAPSRDDNPPWSGPASPRDLARKRTDPGADRSTPSSSVSSVRSSTVESSPTDSFASTATPEGWIV